MRIIVTGGRKYDNYAHIEKVLGEYDKKFGKCTLVHGGAGGYDKELNRLIGADMQCGDVALSLGWTVHCIPADWSKYGLGAGPKRNQAMVDEGADLVIVFPGGKGTANCRKQAEKAGIKVRVEMQ